MTELQYAVDKDSTVPLHYQVSQSLKNYIKVNKLKPGDKIPSEKMLCKMFGLSRTTIRHGINQLVKEGMLVRNIAKGTFVSNPVIERSYTKLLSLTEEFQEMGIKLRAKFLKKEIILASQDLADLLEIKPGGKIIFILRRIKKIEEPLCINYYYLPCKFFDLLQDEDLSVAPILAMARDKLGISPSRARQNISAAKASKLEAKHLEIREGDPVLVIERIYMSSSKHPIWLKRMVFRCDKYSYQINLIR